MSIRTAFSTSRDPRTCASELRAQIGAFDPRLVAFFASARFDAAALGAALRREFGDVPSLGCTTAGELQRSTQLEGSVFMMALDAGTVRSAHVELIRDSKSETERRRTINELAARVGETPAGLDPERYVGMVIHDGLSRTEEAVMACCSSLTNVPFVGGTAGDDLAFQGTTCFVNFEPHPHKGLLALLEPVHRYSILKTQSYEVLDQILEVTSVDEETRTVHTFNGRPAASEFARHIGVPVEQLSSYTRKFAVGLVTPAGEPFVRAAAQPGAGDSLSFYCQVKQGMRLNLLRATDILEGTRRDLGAKLAQMGGCEGLIEFQCILRTLELDSAGQTAAYARLFAEIPYVAFSTYGESYIGHQNQTSTMLLFGRG